MFRKKKYDLTFFHWKSFFQPGMEKKKKIVFQENSWDTVSVTQGSSMTPARASLSSWPEHPSNLFFCAANPKTWNWFQVTLFTWQSSGPQLKSSQWATCRPSPGNPRLGIWMWGWRAGRSWGLSSWLGSSGNWRGEGERKATVINKKAVLHAGIHWSKLGMRLQSESPVSVVLYQHKPMQPPALARLCSNSYSSLNRLDLCLSVLPTWIGLHKKKHRININKHNTQL